MKIYTDGACINNGQRGARAGIGIFFGVGHPQNVSRSISGNQTNNTAELSAIVVAIKMVEEYLEVGEQVTIYSDSIYAIRCCGEYGEKMSARGWKGKKGKPMPNAELVQVAWTLCSQWPNLALVHVRAHTGGADEHSIGNDWADRLATAGAGGSGLPRQRRASGAAAAQERGVVLLNVPYDEKDEAKRYGARWNPSKKKWYIPAGAGNTNRAILETRWGGSA